MTTVNCTPTWSGVAPWLIEVIKSGTPEGIKAAEIELKRMAEAADRFREIAVLRHLDPKTPKHIQVAEVAGQIFWEVVGMNYPDIKTGDFPPLETHEFDSMLQKSVDLWVKFNS